MPKLLRRALTGFTVGAAAGWAAGLLRTPSPERGDGSAAAALRLPQQEFGDPPGDAGQSVQPGEQEGATVPEPSEQADQRPRGTARPARRRRGAAEADPAAAAAAALRAGSHEAKRTLGAAPGGSAPGAD